MSIINTALIGKLKKTKADKNNVLELDNVSPYVPTEQYHPATKGYIDSALGAGVADVVLFTAGDAPPTNPTIGMEWLNYNNGRTYKWIKDSNNTELWLDITATGTSDVILRESDLITVTDANVDTYGFSYNVQFIQVFMNRLKLRSSEFTATNGSTITILVELQVDDELEFVTI